MRSHRQHVDAICRELEAALGREPEKLVRRLLRPQLRLVADRLGDPDANSLAHGLGVLARVEAARDEHLASLDADEGLAALAVPWQDVVARVAAREPVRPRVQRRRGG